jgi:hypothetical protein
MMSVMTDFSPISIKKNGLGRKSKKRQLGLPPKPGAARIG